LFSKPSTAKATFGVAEKAMAKRIDEVESIFIFFVQWIVVGWAGGERERENSISAIVID